MRLTRRQLLLWLLAGAAAAATGASVASAYRFRTVRLSTRLAGLRAPLRVTLLADLHYGPLVGAGSVAAWVAASNAEAPDLVLLDGDLVDRRAGDVGPLLRELARLRAELGRYAVWGNHDHVCFGDLSGFAADLRTAGIEVLVNRGRVVRPDLYLAGIDDLRRGHPDLGAALADRPEGAATLLLSHNPDILPEVPPAVGLTVSGHTHGGQVRLPFVGALVTSSRYGQRFAQGWVEGPARGYVTHGLGVSLLPIRVDCPAELTVLDLLPSETA